MCAYHKNNDSIYVIQFSRFIRLMVGILFGFILFCENVSPTAALQDCGGYHAIELSQSTNISTLYSFSVGDTKFYNMILKFSAQQRNEIESLLWGAKGNITTVTLCIGDNMIGKTDWFSHLWEINKISFVVAEAQLINVRKISGTLRMGSDGSH